MDPTTDRGRTTRARIIESAARLIHVKGVSATSVDEVLAHSGAGKSQFYHYFRSKDDLVGAVLDLQAARAEAEQADIFAAQPGWKGIRAWLDTVVESQRRSGYVGGCPIGSLAAEASERDPALRRRLQGAFDRKVAVLAGRLTGLRAAGELHPDADPDALAAFVTSTLQGALLLASTFKSGDALSEAVEHAWLHLTSFRLDAAPAAGASVDPAAPGQSPPGPSGPQL